MVIQAGQFKTASDFGRGVAVSTACLVGVVEVEARGACGDDEEVDALLSESICSDKTCFFFCSN